MKLSSDIFTFYFSHLNSKEQIKIINYLAKEETDYYAEVSIVIVPTRKLSLALHIDSAERNIAISSNNFK